MENGFGYQLWNLEVCVGAFLYVCIHLEGLLHQEQLVNVCVYYVFVQFTHAHEFCNA